MLHSFLPLLQQEYLALKATQSGCVRLNWTSWARKRTAEALLILAEISISLKRHLDFVEIGNRIKEPELE